MSTAAHPSVFRHLLRTVGLVLLLASPRLASAAPAIDTTVYSDGTNARTTGAFSTPSSGDLLVAFVSFDGASSAQSATVSGAALSWTLVWRTATQRGTAEIWQAQAAGKLSNVRVTATPGVSGYAGSLTVVAFSGASGIGAFATASASSGAPSATLVTTATGSRVFGVGVDPDRNAGRTLGSGQTLVHQYLASSTRATAWVQRANATTPAPGTSVVINDTAPSGDRFNLTLCEILGASADVTPPTITSVTPASGATGVSTGSAVAATFSESMNPASITSLSIFLQAGGNPVATTLAYNAATNTATLTPTSALSGLTVYTATVVGGASGVTDASGNRLASTLQWSFTTADTTPPTLTAMAPSPGATGVPSGTTVQATFSEAMSSASITGATFFLQTGASSVAATVAYDANAHVATLTPSTALASGSAYTVTVKGGASGVKDASGNPLAADRQWSFTVADTTRPTITAHTPVSGATGVSVNATVTATFNEAMDPSTIGALTVDLRDASHVVVPATVTYNSANNVVSLVPNSALVGGATYTATVHGTTGGVADLAGNVLAADVEWSFQTVIPDTTPPTITNIAPADGQTSVVTTTPVTVRFSEAMMPSSISGSTIALRNSSNTLVTASVTYSALTFAATLQPSAPLAIGATYTVTILGGTSGVKDVAGNALEASVSSIFTTAACPCSLWTMTTRPGGMASDANGVELGMKFRSDSGGYITGIRFYKYSQNTGTHTGHVWTTGGTLLGSLTFSGESASGWQQGTFASPVAISANTTYIVSYYTSRGYYAATGSGFTNGVDNVPLHALANSSSPNGVFRYGTTSGFPNSTWNASNYWVDIVFVTSLADTTPPAVTAVSPAGGSANVSLSAPVAATFSEAINSGTISPSTFFLQRNGLSVDTALAYNATTHVATLTPSSALAGGTTYTVTVKGGPGGVMDTAGNPLAADVVWSFMTTAPDVAPPSVTAVTPTDGSSNVPSSTTVTAAFSEALDGSTVDGSSFILETGGSSVAASVAYNSAAHVATLTPSAPLAAGAVYTAAVRSGSGGVTDAAGNPLAVDFVWSFSTAPPDTTPPSITGTAPSGTSVPVTTVVTATFSESMSAATLDASTFFIQAEGAVVPASVSYDDATSTATLTPSAALAMLTPYTVTVKGGPVGASDAAGNPLDSDVMWSFTTAADTVPPALTAKTPASGATGIPPSAVVTATFSEAMDPASFNINTVTLQTSSGAFVTAGLTYDALTRIVNVIPSSALATNSLYTATVRGGAGGVTDLAGNPIASTVTWSFTTGGALTANTQVTVNTSSVRQTLGALGGDYAWWQSDSPIGQFTLANLHPQHARVNMYLPEWEPVNDNSDPQTFNWAAFQDVGYTHINFLQMQDFERRGMTMVISVWDAPNWMVSNPGATSQRVIPSSMWDEAIESMAAYLLYARDQYGVTVDYMSINEADGGYNLQFSAADMNSFIKRAVARFSALGLPTKWLAGDTANASGVVSYATPMLQDSTTRQYLGPISVHTWGATGQSDSTFTGIYDLATQYGRQVWVEELGLSPNQGDNKSYTTTYSYAMGIATLYQRMITLLHATVLDYWEYGDDYDLADPNMLVPYSVYYAIKPLTDYLVPGTDIVTVSSSNANVTVIAGRNDARQSAIVYAVNNATTAQTVNFSGLPTGVMTMLRTSSNEHMVTVGSYNPVSGGITLVLPAQSINALVAGDPLSAYP